jgi:DNA-directed RNA polymerase subunit RPC12/RpoP
MFGAVVCPRCRKGFAVDLEHRSSTCPHCGRLVQTRRMKTHFTSNSASLTAQAVAELNTKGRELKGFKGKMDVEMRAPYFKPSMLEDLVLELEEFDLAVLEKALDGRMGAEEALQRLISSGFVYECAPGRYRIA